MPKTYRSEASSVVHEIAESLYGHGIIDKVTIQEFDESCLVPTPELTAEEIKALRERGIKKPGGPALRLLAIVKDKGLGGISL
ncbi:MAG: transcriptional regulator [Deltaproteobacteria bacterium]|jgi:putative transcriptional regulator|nr:transcriptional regulator [Deltaproteobacteria bacterium]